MDWEFLTYCFATVSKFYYNIFRHPEVICTEIYKPVPAWAGLLLGRDPDWGDNIASPLCLFEINKWSIIITFFSTYYKTPYLLRISKGYLGSLQNVINIFKTFYLATILCNSNLLFPKGLQSVFPLIVVLPSYTHIKCLRHEVSSIHYSTTPLYRLPRVILSKSRILVTMSLEMYCVLDFLLFKKTSFEKYSRIVVRLWFLYFL